MLTVIFLYYEKLKVRIISKEIITCLDVEVVKGLLISLGRLLTPFHYLSPFKLK